MLREIRIYGQLAKFVGKRKFWAAVDSAAEAVRFLIANFPGLEAHMCEPGRNYQVMIGDYALDEQDLHGPTGNSMISFIPVIGGAGAAGKIFAGIGLIALSVLSAGLLSGFAFGFAGGIAGLGTFATIGVGIGVNLILGGVSQLLTPTPVISAQSASGGFSGGNYNSGTRQTEMDPQKSYSFSGIQNTSRQGVPVPLIYGETIVGSVVISAGIDTEQVLA